MSLFLKFMLKMYISGSFWKIGRSGFLVYLLSFPQSICLISIMTSLVCYMPGFSGIWICVFIFTERSRKTMTNPVSVIILGAQIVIYYFFSLGKKLGFREMHDSRLRQEMCRIILEHCVIRKQGNCQRLLWNLKK